MTSTNTKNTTMEYVNDQKKRIEHQIWIESCKRKVQKLIGQYEYNLAQRELVSTPIFVNVNVEINFGPPASSSFFRHECLLKRANELIANGQIPKSSYVSPFVCDR